MSDNSQEIKENNIVSTDEQNKPVETAQAEEPKQEDTAKAEEPKQEESANAKEPKQEEPAKAEAKKETPKENLFDTFDMHKKRASNHEQYSTDLFLEYHDSFDSEKKKIIKAFRILYEANNNDIQVIDEADDKEQKIIIDFWYWTKKLPKNGIWWFRFWHWIKGIFTKKSRAKAKFKDETQKAPKMLKEEKDYIVNRYFAAQKFYSKRADDGKKYFFRSQKTILVLSVIIPIVAILYQLTDTIIQDIDKELVCPKWVGVTASLITAGFSAIIAYLTSKDKLYSWLKHWTKNRDLSERLKREYALYKGRSGEYAKVEGETIEEHSAVERKFRENVEAIIEDGREYLNAYGNRKRDEK